MPGKKYIYEFDLKDAVGYENMKDLVVVESSETKEICGLKCKKAVGTSAAFNNKPFDIYYTDEIKIADPNMNSPFQDIKGVLLQFTADMNNISMSLIAEKVSEIEIEDEIFDKPEGYTSVSKDEMLNIVNEFNMKKTQ
jgi:GLPGLI family protein